MQGSRRARVALKTVTFAAVAFVLVIAVAACGQTASSKGGPNAKRAQVETVANFVVASVKGDRSRMGDFAVDPEADFVVNEPVGSDSAIWQWDGDRIIVTIQGAEVTLTVRNSNPDQVVVATTDGDSATFNMQQIGGSWKIAACMRPLWPNSVSPISAPSKGPARRFRPIRAPCLPRYRNSPPSTSNPNRSVRPQGIGTCSGRMALSNPAASTATTDTGILSLELELSRRQRSASRDVACN